MNTAFIGHTTLAGERWDLLAWNYYGDPTLFSLIIMANPQLSIEPVFEAGLMVGIPTLQASPVRQNDLPPWKQSGR